MILDKFSLRGHIGIVTGGGAGLGTAYVQAVAEAGASVMIADKDIAAGNNTAERMRSGGFVCDAIETDVTCQNGVIRLVDETLKKHGQIDFIINNAGAWFQGAAIDVTPKSWQSIIDLNLSGVFWCCQAVAKPMLERGRGSIINIASISGQLINPPSKTNWLEPSYFAAKAGVIHLTHSLAAQWGPNGIRTNTIAPGYMAKNGINEQIMKAPWLKSVPLGRPGLPEDLGGAAVFLASDASSYVNGHTLNIDGGCTVW